MSAVVITDASVLLNIYATGRESDILTSSGFEFFVCPAVVKEVICLKDRKTGEVEELSLSESLESGALQLLEPETDEDFDYLIDYSAQLGPGGDGEAMCFALAHPRGCWVAIDDRRAIIRALRMNQDFKTLGTVEILQAWQREQTISHEEMSGLLTLIERWARYRPARTHEGFVWWETPVL